MLQLLITRLAHLSESATTGHRASIQYLVAAINQAVPDHLLFFLAGGASPFSPPYHGTHTGTPFGRPLITGDSAEQTTDHRPAYRTLTGLRGNLFGQLAAFCKVALVLRHVHTLRVNNHLMLSAAAASKQQRQQQYTIKNAIHGLLHSILFSKYQRTHHVTIGL
jgi:hypothetical protein